MKTLDELALDYIKAKNNANIAWNAYDEAWEMGNDNTSAATLAAINAQDAVEDTWEIYQKARKVARESNL